MMELIAVVVLVSMCAFCVVLNLPDDKLTAGQFAFSGASIVAWYFHMGVLSDTLAYIAIVGASISLWQTIRSFLEGRKKRRQT